MPETISASNMIGIPARIPRNDALLTETDTERL